MVMQSVSRNSVRVLWLCHTESPIKKGMASLKAGIQAKLEKFQQPHKMINNANGQVVGDVPDTGPGCDSWVWDSKGGMLDFTKAESDHLRENYNAVMDGPKGFPAILSLGVAEVDMLLTNWSATHKPDPTTEPETEKPPAD